VPGPESLIPFAAFWLVAVLTPGPNMLLFTWLAVSKPSRICAQLRRRHPERHADLGAFSRLRCEPLRHHLRDPWTLWLGLADVALMLAMSASYCLICLWLLTRPGALALYARSERYITAGAGIIFATFGLQLLASGLLTA